MDRAFAKVCDSICLAGPHGLTVPQLIDEIKREFKMEVVTEANWSYLMTLFAQLEPEFSFGTFTGKAIRKGDQNQLFYWAPVTKTSGASLNDAETRIYCTSLSLINSTLLDGRLISLTENSLLALQLIGSFGRNGVNQADMARLLGCDPKTVFHFLKPLIVNDLIIRTPISVSRAFTYQITLSRFEDDEFEANDSGRSDNISSVEMRQMIIDLLAQAPNRCMTSRDIFAASGVHRSMIKAFRRAVLLLNEKGWIEIAVDHQLYGQNLRYFRLIRQGDYRKTEITVDPAPLPECEYDPNVPIANQFVKLIAQAYPEGLLVGEACARLGVSVKYLYRLIDRVFIPKNEGLVKIADFVGKEKRLKLFVKDAEWQRKYLELCNAQVETTSALPLSSQVSSLLSSRPSSPMSTSSSSNTLTRHIRHEALLAELQEKQILEVGKSLAVRVQERIGDTKHILDVKTLRRSIDILAVEGKLVQVNVTVPSGSKTIIFVPEWTVESAQVLDFIAFLRDGGKAPKNFPKLSKPTRLQQAQVDDPDFYEPVEYPADQEDISITAQYRFALEKFGFVQGIMLRTALLHKHLLQYHTQTINVTSIYESLTFGEFLQIIGMIKMSRELYARREELLLTPLSELDATAKEELTWYRKRFHTQLELILQILSQLELISSLSGDESKLSAQFELKQQVSLFGQRFDFSNNNDYERFWSALRGCAQVDSRHITSIYDAEETRSVLLARHPDSWKRSWKRSWRRHRDLLRQVRSLASKILSTERSKHRRMNTTNPLVVDSHDEAILQLAEKYEEAVERVRSLLSDAIQGLEKHPRSERKATRDEPDEDDAITAQEAESKQFSSLTEEESRKVQMSFALLQHPRFLSTDGTFKWQLVSQILERPIDSSALRRQGMSVCRSYDDLLVLLEYDVIAQVILSASPADLEFSDAFKLCWSAINSEDLFACAAALELPPNRREYFWDLISEWNLPRSFRHEYFRNLRGLAQKRKFEAAVNSCELARAIRRVLVWANFDDFSSETAFQFLQAHGGTDDSVLQSALDSLFQSGFAVKTRTRNRFRLLGFPVALSEVARRFLVGTEDDSPDACYFDEFGRELERQQKLASTLTTLTVNTNNSLLQTFGHEAISELLKMKLEIKDLGRIGVTANANAKPVAHDFTPLSNANEAIWINCDGSFNEKVGRRCLRAVERVVGNSPGISKDKIYAKLTLLLPSEIDTCLQFLCTTQHISTNDSLHFE